MERVKKSWYCGIVAATAVLFLAVVVLLGKPAKADPDNTPAPTQDLDYVNKEQYIDGYFDGTISSAISTNVNVRSGPGTSYEVVKTSTGAQVKLVANTALKIVGESRDDKLDGWYHIFAEFQGEMIEGYCFGEFVTVSAKVTFTPTPTPDLTATITEAVPTIPGSETVFATPTPVPPVNDEELGKSNPYKYILIFSIVIILLIVIYTIFSRSQEKKLEKEMERYSKRSRYIEPLDGESEEDFELAKKKLYRYEIDVPEGTESSEEYEDADDELSFGEEEFELELEDDIAIDNPEMEEIGGGERTSAAEELSEEFVVDLDGFENEFDAPESEAASDVQPEAPADEDSDMKIYQETYERKRSYLDTLAAGEEVVHKLYGDGVIIDNSDAEIIQIRFGRDLRFLKKDKLARKDLVEFE